MTQAEIKRLREALGLDAFAFAAVLGVHVSTVYRWEGGARPLWGIDPLQAEILAALADCPAKKELGMRILRALLKNRLHALRILLETVA